MILLRTTPELTTMTVEELFEQMDARIREYGRAAGSWLAVEIELPEGPIDTRSVFIALHAIEPDLANWYADRWLDLEKEWEREEMMEQIAFAREADNLKRYAN